MKPRAGAAPRGNHGGKASWSRRGEESQQHLAELKQRLEATLHEIDILATRPMELTDRREALAAEIEGAEARRREAADVLATGETGSAKPTGRSRKPNIRWPPRARTGFRAEAAVAQAEQVLANITERVLEKLYCGLEQVLEIAEIDTSQELPAHDEVERKLARLMRERDNMGPVNLRADVEAKELDQQITGMQTERADLVAAIGRLRQGVASLNREGRERLLAAFEQVNKHFSELFVRLFGGGRAHLKLTEAEDPLQAGLEIMASRRASACKSCPCSRAASRR